MILTAGGTLVCSTCGNESQAGNRFCGLCGTPLPHRPLDTPGAQGTMSLTRGPLESSQPPERQSAAVGIAGAQVPAETSGDELNQPADLPPSKETVSEDPLHVFAENLDHAQPYRPEEVATTGEALAMPSDVLAFADALPPVEQSHLVEASQFPWMEDVLQQIAELEAKPPERTDERSPFLDLLDELAPPVVEPEASTPAAVTPSFSEISDGPQTIAGSDVTTPVQEPAGRRWRLWLATAAVLVFAALGTIWWSYRNYPNNGVVAVIERKIRDLKPSVPTNTNNDQSSMSAGSAAPKTSSPAIRTEEQSMPQDQSVAARASVPSTAPDGKSETTKTTVPATVASQVQSPPPTGSSSAMSQQVSPVDKTPPAGQKSATTYPPATTGSSKATAPQPTAKATLPAVEKPKPIPQATRNEDRPVAAKKAIPGNLEMTKAKEASDTAAQVAWLWKATAKGNPDAPLRLADMYIKGDAVPRSCVQALVLLRTAALDDNVQACNRLASMYTVGLCVSRNHVKAYRWLSAAVAADPGSQWAQQNRDLLWQQMTPEERALAEKYR